MDGGVSKVIATPLSDSDIHDYLPNSNIIKYSDLSKYPTLNDLLPEVKSFCFILYEDSPNKGHWTVVSKPKDDLVEYFDSYGGVPDAPLKWTPKERRVGLGEGKELLSYLFNKCPEQVVYNKIDYQNEGQEVNDCGRWCILRTLKMIKGLDLNQFHKFVKEQAKMMKAPFDVVVSKLIP
jgi:hypothetical protein